MSTKRYVCGLLFTDTMGEVALIRKARPDWQAGKLNGIGGSIEEGETPPQAMLREYGEEASGDIYNWIPFMVMGGGKETMPGALAQGQPWEVHWFYATTVLLPAFRTDTEEPVVVVSVPTLFQCRTVLHVEPAIHLAMLHRYDTKQWTLIAGGPEFGR